MREKEDLQEILEKEFKWFHENPELSFEEYETTKRIKEILKREINAIYISNNSMTLGFLKALKELNINPESMEIATFEDNEIIRFIDEKIVSYDIPFSELSKKSIEILESLLKNDTSDTTVEINL